jgi:hypothetical protein
LGLGAKVQETAAVSIEISPILSVVEPPLSAFGTAAYMSPKQARGKTVDKRAVIWKCLASACQEETLLAGEKCLDKFVVRSKSEYFPLMKILQEIFYGPDIKLVKSISPLSRVDANHFVHLYALTILEVTHSPLPFSIPSRR